MFCLADTEYQERGHENNEDESSEDEDDQSETGDESSDSETEDGGQDAQNDGNSESPGGEDIDNHGTDPSGRGTDNAVGPGGYQGAVKIPADMLLAQIREKLSSIPGLGMSNESPHNELIEYLTASMAKLSAENGMLKKALQAAKERPLADGVKLAAQTSATENANEQENGPDQPEEPVSHEVHLVKCSPQKNTYFRDVPRMFKGDQRSDHLRGRQGLENMATYLKKRKQVAFVIVHNYQCSCAGGTDYHRVVGYKDGRLIDDSPLAESETKHIVCNMSLKKAMTDISKAHPGSFEGWNVKKLPRYSYEPHYLYYVHHKTFLELADSSNLSEFDARSIKLVCNWVAEKSKEGWDEADEMFKRGKVATQHYSKLFRPGELVVRQQSDRPGITWVYKIDNYPWPSGDSDEAATCHRWSFNGRFYKIQANLHFSHMFSQSQSAISADDGEVDITSINIFPLRFAKPELYNSLLARGSRFWSCRKKKIVSYHDPDLDGEDGSRGVSSHLRETCASETNDACRSLPSIGSWSTTTSSRECTPITRYSAPRPTIWGAKPCLRKNPLTTSSWRCSHPRSMPLTSEQKHGVRHLSLSIDCARTDQCVCVTELLRVDRITDVTWNKDAFRQLVLPKETKELIQAAVMAQGRLLGASPDIIAGKGQGLLILLHGGPGTGKTLTAESIAETQERPLYRVTCGDIGIEPAHVERVCCVVPSALNYLTQDTSTSNLCSPSARLGDVVRHHPTA